MPSRLAVAGLSMTTGAPSNSRRPASGWMVPEMIFTRVDLPAPLSPSSATTSPACTVKSTSRRASTAPKLLDRPSMASTGGLPRAAGPARETASASGRSLMAPLYRRRHPFSSWKEFFVSENPPAILQFAPRSEPGASERAAAAVNDSDHSSRIGPSLGTIRKAKGWTLKQFSDVTGVSVATLSKVENDQAGLSFGTVLKIVNSLGMTFEELLSAGAGEAGRGRRAVNRAGSGVRLATRQYDYEIFAAELVAKRMVPLITRVKARTTADFPHLLGHAGEEWIYVLKGAVEFHTEYYAPVVL